MIGKKWIVGLIGVVLVVAGYAQAEIVVDNFDEGVLNPVWEVVTQTSGATWNESGGTLNIGGLSGQAEELTIRHKQPLANVGSVRIDYNWTAYSGHKARVVLGLFDSSWIGEGDDQVGLGDGVYIKGVRYRSNGLHAIDGGGTDAGYQIAYSVPTSGAFMIERNDDVFRASYLNGGAWQTLFDGQRDFGGEFLYPYLFTSNSDSKPSWQVALDNFQADVVPEPTVPEPTSFVLWSGLGIMAILAGRQRKRTA